MAIRRHAYAVERIRREGLEDQVEIRLADYRQTTGSFDRIVSIEMFEAVGEQYWPALRLQGFDERFRRLWTFYLAYCEAGFATGRTDVIQAVVSRP